MKDLPSVPDELRIPVKRDEQSRSIDAIVDEGEQDAINMSRESSRASETECSDLEEEMHFHTFKLQEQEEHFSPILLTPRPGLGSALNPAGPQAQASATSWFFNNINTHDATTNAFDALHARPANARSDTGGSLPSHMPTPNFSHCPSQSRTTSNDVRTHANVFSRLYTTFGSLAHTNSRNQKFVPGDVGLPSGEFVVGSAMPMSRESSTATNADSYYNLDCGAHSAPSRTISNVSSNSGSEDDKSTIRPLTSRVQTNDSAATLKGIAPADKFTNKWPRPRSTRRAATSMSPSSASGPSRRQTWLSRNSSKSSTSQYSLLSGAGLDTLSYSQPRNGRNGATSSVFGASAAGAGMSTLGIWEMKDLLLEESGLGLDLDVRGSWTVHKWCLFFSVLSVLALGIAGVMGCVLTWFAGTSPILIRIPPINAFSYFILVFRFVLKMFVWRVAHLAYPLAPPLLTTDTASLTLLTLSSCLLLLASLFGLSGTLLNSRPILALYTLLLIPAFISWTSVGYATYKKSTFKLDRKLSGAWFDVYGDSGRVLLQSALECCGWVNADHGAVYSPGGGVSAGGMCWPRTILPGCEGPLIRFEKDVLGTIYGVIFSVVPLLLISLCVALLCSNHVTQRFGKGIMPKKYRLSGKDLEVLWGEREAKAAETKAALEDLRELGGGDGLGLSESTMTLATTISRASRVAEEFTAEVRALNEVGLSVPKNVSRGTSTGLGVGRFRNGNEGPEEQSQGTRRRISVRHG